MTIQRFKPIVRRTILVAMVLTAVVGTHVSVAWGQRAESGRPGVQVRVTAPSQRLEMIANSSRILKLEHKVPRFMVDDTTVLRVAPLAPDQLQVSALKPGFTQLTVWDEVGAIRTVDVVVIGDARELENLLASEFPDATLKVRPTAASVIISGHVPRPEMVHRVVTIAEDYYPKVINNISVSGAQEILLHVRVLEVSRSKLRKLGFDWANFNGNDGVVQNAAGLIGSYTIGGTGSVVSNRGESIAFGVLNGDNAFFGFIESLRRNNLVKVMSNPTLVTVSGRPASFNVGGEFPILVPQTLGTSSVQFREFGTRVDFVPIVLGNGSVRLEVRPQVSEIDASRGVTLNNTTVPGIRTRWADTGVEMKAGQTLALAGLTQIQEEAENKGLPFFADLPWVGAAFRRVQMVQNEIELLILVTPEFADAMDAHEVPPCGPGQMTMPPNDRDLYARGYLEVPTCDDGCQNCATVPYAGSGYSGGMVGTDAARFPSPQSYQNTPTPAVPPVETSRVTPRNANNYTSARLPSATANPVAPASANVSDSSKNRYFQNYRTNSATRPTNPSREATPSFIGPVGYELSK